MLNFDRKIFHSSIKLGVIMKQIKLLISLTFIISILYSVNQSYAQSTYVGSNTCKTCHNGQHSDWNTSGHPYKIQKLQNGQGPQYPPSLTATYNFGPSLSYTIQPGVPRPPKGFTWETVGFVMGGYHSNARFLDTLGYLILGDTAQYNIPTNKWVRYVQSAPGSAPYTYACYKCHTTGPSQTKTTEFEKYPGIEGSWAEYGVGCEACHGPGSAHISNPTGVKPSKEGYETCNNCHARDRSLTNTRVEWLPATVGGEATGFIRHREQGDMMIASKHHLNGMTCATCHNPHKSVYYKLGGIKTTVTCEGCHPGHEIPGHSTSVATCTDCHMPNAAKNGDQITKYVSEQSAHFWKILTDPITMFDNLDTVFVPGKKYIKIGSDGLSGLTLDYACLQCHSNQDVNWAAQYAANIHSLGIPVELTSLTASTGGNGILLKWTTATETNNKGFEIQRKLGSSKYATIGSVEGKGTTTYTTDYSFIDRPQSTGKYVYRLKQIDFDGTYEYSKSVEIDWTPVEEFALAQNYPNPFNPTTTLKYNIKEKVNVRLSVMNLLGEEVALLVNEDKDAGSYSVIFNAVDMPSGVYYYQIKAGNFVETKKMVLLK
jgi:hypothetical protein